MRETSSIKERSKKPCVQITITIAFAEAETPSHTTTTVQAVVASKIIPTAVA